MIAAATMPPSKYADIGEGLRIHYHEVGNGPRADLSCTVRDQALRRGAIFQGNLAALSANHRVYLVDMPQFGKSSKPVITGPRLTAFHQHDRGVHALRGHRASGFHRQLVRRSGIVENGDRLSRSRASRRNHRQHARSRSARSRRCRPKACASSRITIAVRVPRSRSCAICSPRWFTMRAISARASLKERYETSLDPELIEVNTGPRPEYEDLTMEFKTNQGSYADRLGFRRSRRPDRRCALHGARDSQCAHARIQ